MERRRRGAKRVRQLHWAAAGLAVVTLLMAALFVAQTHRQDREHHLQQLHLQAEVLQDHSDSTLNAVARRMRTAVAELGATGETTPGVRAEQILKRGVANMAPIRSLSLIRADGLIVASSAPDAREQLMPGTWLAPRGEGRPELSAAAHGTLPPHLSPLGSEPNLQLSLPLVLAAGSDAPGHYLLALVAGEYFVNEFEHLLRLDGVHAVLLQRDRRALVSNQHLLITPGSALPASHEDEGWLRAEAALDEWPLVVVARMPYGAWSPAVREALLWSALFLGFCWTALAMATRTAQRALDRDGKLMIELSQRNAELGASEARKLAILQSALDAIISIDDAGQVHDFNLAAETMFGVSAAQAHGMSLSKLLPHCPGLPGGITPPDSLWSGQRLEITAKRVDGSGFPAEITVVPTTMPDGQRVFTVTLRDLTARRRIEHALSESLDLLDKTGDIGNIGGWSFDVRSQRMSWTSQTARILEVGDKQAPDLQQFLELFDGDPQTQLRQAMQLSIARGEGFDLELPLQTRRGSRLWLRVVMRPEQKDGQALHLSGAIQDITSRKRVEDELAAAHARELEVGARIQQSLLVTPAPAQLAGLLLSGFNQASQGIDGDFVGILRSGPSSVDLIVGDVMGKGMAAAMLGAATKLEFSRAMAQARLAFQDLPRPCDIVAAVHRALTPTLQSLDAFVTLCYLRVDTERGRLTWVGCGHEESLVLGEEAPRCLANQHPPMGVIDDADYEQSEVDFRAGDLLFLCSDGLSDAVMPGGERLGRDQLIAAVQRRYRQHRTPGALLQGLRLDLQAWQARVTDDLTMLAVAFPQEEGGPLRRLELPAQMSSLAPLRHMLAESTEGVPGLSPEERGLIEVAAVEVFTNLVRHDKPGIQDAPIELLLRQQPAELVLEFAHASTAFQPPSQSAPIKLEQFPEGGFGLHIIRSVFDEVQYGHTEGINTVRLVRRLPPR